jgi:hypothetical protein
MTPELWYFLDDEREPVLSDDRHWVIFRRGEDLIAMLKHTASDGLPDGIAFDHDLGNGMTGHDTAKAILEMVMDGELRVFEDFQYEIHSQNPIGVQNIRGTMSDIFRFALDIKS